MADLSKFLCPFCGSEPVSVGKLVHCASLSCVLNRVDVPEVQWESRPLEEELIGSNDRLRDTINRQSESLILVGSSLRKMQADQAGRLARWRAEKGLPAQRVTREPNVLKRVR